MAQFTPEMGQVKPQEYFLRSHIFMVLCDLCIIFLLIDRRHPEVKVVVVLA